MNTLPYLDTEEKLRAFTKQHWHIDIEPALISAHCEDSDSVLIFPSDAYRLYYSPMACCSSVGAITYNQKSLVHPCVLAVLKEAYRKKLEAKYKEDETIKQVRDDIHIRGLALLKEAMNEPYHEKKQCEDAPPKGWLARLLQKWKQS